MIRRLASLLLVLVAVAALAEKRAERLIAADVTPTGELVTATLRGSDRIVFSALEGEAVASEEVELVGVSGGDVVVQARVGPYGDTHYLALVVRRGAKCTYHYVLPAVVDERAPRNPFPQLPRYELSDPIFESTGEPYRVVSATTPGGDSIEIVFQRGWAYADATKVARGEGPEQLARKLQQRIYHNVCPSAGLTSGALWDVTGVQAAR